MKGAQLLEHMIRFTHITVGTNRDTYISSSLNVEVSQDQQQYLLYPCVEYLNYRYIELAAVGKGAKKKISNRKLDSLSKSRILMALLT